MSADILEDNSTGMFNKISNSPSSVFLIKQTFSHYCDELLATVKSRPSCSTICVGGTKLMIK